MTNRRTGVKIPHTLIIRLDRLMRMEYTIPELARELKWTPKKIRTLFAHGCPHRRDDKGKVWILGTAFRTWAEATLKGNRHPMEDGQGWCLACNKAVEMVDPLSPRQTTRHLGLVEGKCPLCGGTVNRGIKWPNR